MQKMTLISTRLSKNYSLWAKVEKGENGNLGKESASPDREVEVDGVPESNS
jgi:hypothetical protein